MGTHALIQFKDEFDSCYVFQHYDGFPGVVLDNIKKALKLAWPLPRFEASEIAAAYIAANKDGPGNIRLANNNFNADYMYIVNQHGEVIITNSSGDYNNTFNLTEL